MSLKHTYKWTGRTWYWRQCLGKPVASACDCGVHGIIEQHKRTHGYHTYASWDGNLHMTTNRVLYTWRWNKIKVHKDRVRIVDRKLFKNNSIILPGIKGMQLARALRNGMLEGWSPITLPTLPCLVNRGWREVGTLRKL